MKSESTLEFFMNYTWAIIVIIVIGVALFASGAFNINDSTADTHTKQAGIINIIDYKLKNNSLTLKISPLEKVELKSVKIKYGNSIWRCEYPGVPENSKISYWISKKVNNSYANVWVTVPEIPPHSNVTVYVYYDNPNAVSESNGAKVFTLFENFTNNSVGANWHLFTKNNGKVSISNNTLTEYIGDSAQSPASAVIASNEKVSTNTLIVASIKTETMEYSWNRFGLTTYYNPTYSDNSDLAYSLRTDGEKTGSNSNSAVGIGSNKVEYSQLNHKDDSWYTVEVGVTKNAVWSSNDFGKKYYVNGNLTNAEGYVYFGAYKYYSGTTSLIIKWIGVGGYYPNITSKIGSVQSTLAIPGWKYRIPITISNPTNTYVTNYTMMVNLTHEEGMSPTFSDIRTYFKIGSSDILNPGEVYKINCNTTSNLGNYYNNLQVYFSFNNVMSGLTHSQVNYLSGQVE